MIFVKNRKLWRLKAWAGVACIQTAAAFAQQPVVAVDVGHGVQDMGATSARGVGEFQFNRQLAEKLMQALEGRGLKVRPINFAGDVAELAERPRLASGSDFFISLHHDSINAAYLRPWEWQGRALDFSDEKRGFGLFISSWGPDVATSSKCASAVGASLRLAEFAPSDWHGRKHQAVDATNGVWYYDNLVVLYRTTMPALLLEAGVIKHREEELELSDPLRQERMAEAVATGLAACLALKETPARE